MREQHANVLFSEGTLKNPLTSTSIGPPRVTNLSTGMSIIAPRFSTIGISCVCVCVIGTYGGGTFENIVEMICGGEGRGHVGLVS